MPLRFMDYTHRVWVNHLLEHPDEVQLPPVNLLRLEADQRAVDEHELIRLGEVIRDMTKEQMIRQVSELMATLVKE